MTIFNHQKIIEPNFDNIPVEFKKISQWVLWKSRVKLDKNGKEFLTKEPCSLEGKMNINWTDKKHWNTFETVKKAYKKGGFNGVGLIITRDDDLVCVDLDDFEDINNIPAEKYNLTLYSYTEISPSGKGLHIWVKGKKPDWVGTKQNGVEFFGDKNKFLTVTGEIFRDAPVRQHQELINIIANKYFHKEKSSSLAVGGQPTTKLDDDVVLTTALENKNTHKLFKGDISSYPSQSEAEYGICKDFARHTSDPKQIERLIRRSMLAREKWDNHPTYLAGTIEKAITETIKDSSLHAPIVPEYNLYVNDESVKDISTSNNIVQDIRTNLEKNPNTGKTVSNARNVETVLTSPIFKDVLAYDSFKNVEVIKGHLPWRKRDHTHKNYEAWLGSDDGRLRHYLGKHFNLKDVGVIQDAHIEMTRQHSFHPIKEYLEAQTWDETPRIETLFIDYLGASDTPYIRAVTRKWMVAAIARIYEAGCKFDYMPVLVGAQGVGKSSLIETLAREWFSDSLKNFESKEAGEQLQNSWIFEFGELAAMKKSAVEEIKAFVSKRSDIYRVAYDRVVSEFPRKCVFIGTTNKSDFLRDQTGNRRFWPVVVEEKRKKYKRTDLTEEIIGLLWAEAMTYYKQGEKLYLDPKMEERARKVQESHMELDPRSGSIEKYLNTDLPPNWDDLTIWERRRYLQNPNGNIPRKRVCAAEIWGECLDNDYTDMKTHEARAIYDMLRNMEEWEERKPNRTRFKHYGTQTTYVRKN